MYTFKYFDACENLRNEVKFKSMPSRDDIENLLWYVDTKSSKRDVDTLMKADGSDVSFSIEDADDELFYEVSFATLELTDC